MAHRETLILSECFGAVLDYSGEYRMFIASQTYSGICFPAEEIQRGQGARRIEIPSLITCAGLFCICADAVTAAHAFSPENLRELVKGMLGKRNPREVQLHSPKIEDYLRVTRELFPNSRMKQIQGDAPQVARISI